MIYLTPAEIENKTTLLINNYEQKYGLVKPPIPIERIAEKFLDLILEWNMIPENSGEFVFAGLAPFVKKVIFNEKRVDIITKTDGLYNTVLAHEVGHWILHVENTGLNNQQHLPGLGLDSNMMYRSTGPSKSIEWQAHTFMTNLMLPTRFLKQDIISEDICDWTSLYHLREKYDVTISAVVTRLQKMGLIYVEDKKIFRTKGEANGQLGLL